MSLLSRETFEFIYDDDEVSEQFARLYIAVDSNRARALFSRCKFSSLNL